MKTNWIPWLLLMPVFALFTLPMFMIASFEYDAHLGGYHWESRTDEGWVDAVFERDGRTKLRLRSHNWPSTSNVVSPHGRTMPPTHSYSFEGVGHGLKEGQWVRLSLSCEEGASGMDTGLCRLVSVR